MKKANQYIEEFLKAEDKSHAQTEILRQIWNEIEELVKIRHTYLPVSLSILDELDLKWKSICRNPSIIKYKFNINSFQLFVQKINPMLFALWKRKDLIHLFLVD